MPKKKETPVLVCPRCGNTHVEKCGSYYQCTSESGEGHYEGNRWVQDVQGCGHLGVLAEFTSQKEITRSRGLS